VNSKEEKIMHTRIKQNILLGVFAFLVAIGLTGCFKGEISVDVKENGSGLIGIALGMTQQAQALLSSQGTNPLEQIQKSLSEQVGLPGDVTVSSWVEDEYEWVKVEKGVKSVDEINMVFADNEIFKSFSLTRTGGLFQNEFILVAELNPLSNAAPSGESVQIDPAAFIQMRFSLRLPGKIEETNGFVDINDSNRMVWTMQGSQPVPIKARLVTWNWLNIIIIAGGGVLIVFSGISAVGFLLYKSSQKTKQRLEPQRIASTEKSLF
jgi:hypothetical protein